MIFRFFNQQVDECENLPKNMCDSCIIQLNVAYNLKKNAIQSDMKLRQYMIEFGINVTSYTTCSINTLSVIRPPAMILPATTTSESVTITTAKSTTVAPQPPPPQPHRPFPVMPVIIKEEPVDYEAMSDITVETNREPFEDHMQHQMNRTNGIHSTTSTSSSSNKSMTPLPVHSMVSVNTKSFLMAPQSSSDSEYISAYMPTPSSTSNSEQSKKTVQSKPTNKQKNHTENGYRPGPKSKAKQVSENQNRNGEAKRRARSREVDKLKDDSAIRMISTDSDSPSPKRQTRQQIKDSHGSDSKTNGNAKFQPSRPRSASKMDYKSYFFRAVTPKMKRRLSMSSSGKQRGRPQGSKNTNKPRYSGAMRKRRNSISQ